MIATVAPDGLVACPAPPRAAHAIRSTDAEVALSVHSDAPGCVVTTTGLEDGVVDAGHGAIRRTLDPAAGHGATLAVGPQRRHAP